MPELPEVEALAAVLGDRLRGHAIAEIQIVGIATLKTVKPAPADLHGKSITAVTRRGKFLVTAAPPHNLIIHLARAGWIRWRDAVPTTPPPRRTPLAMRLRLDDGSGLEVTEQGHEKRLAIYIADDPGEVPGIARLGIDALDVGFDLAVLRAILDAAGNAHLKTVLADQSAIAGIGNAYSDEILHAARLSPLQAAKRLDNDGVMRLHSAIGSVLTAAVAGSLGRPPEGLKDAKRSGFRVHGRGGQTCLVCADVIRTVDLGSRTFQYCPTCQTGGRIYADRRLSKLLR